MIVCHALTKEHELGVAKGWTLSTEGWAEDFNKTEYDLFMKRLDDAIGVYTTLAATRPNDSDMGSDDDDYLSDEENCLSDEEDDL